MKDRRQTEPSPPVRVLHVMDGTHYGGAEEAVARLASHVDRSRAQIEVACMAEGRFTDRLEAARIPYMLIARSKFAIPRAVRQLASLAERREFQILHSHSAKTNLIARLAAKLAGLPHVATIQSPIRLDINDRPKGRRLADAAEGFGARHSARVVFVSEEERRRAIERGLAPDKAVWIPNGVEMPALPPTAARVEALRERWGLKRNRPVVMMLAQLRPRKGPEVLLHALADIRLSMPDVACVFVGDAEFVESRDYLAELKALARELKVHDNAIFTGFCDEPRAAMQLADAIVLPSRFGEGLPLALLEAMAAERAIVTTDTEGNREAVRDGENGLLVPPGDAEALADAIVTLLGDEAMRERMGAEGNRMARERFEIGLVARRHEEMYREVLR